MMTLQIQCLLILRASIACWVTLAVMPIETLYNAIEAELKRKNQL